MQLGSLRQRPTRRSSRRTASGVSRSSSQPSSVTTSPRSGRRAASTDHQTLVAPIVTRNRSDFGLSAKITRVTPDTTSGLTDFNPRGHRRSSPKPSSSHRPCSRSTTRSTEPSSIFEALRPDLVGATVVAVSGIAQKITLKPGVAQHRIRSRRRNSHAPFALNPGDTFTLIEPPPLPFNSDGSIPSWSTSTASLTLKVADASGRTGTLQGVFVSLNLSNFTLAIPPPRPIPKSPSTPSSRR